MEMFKSNFRDILNDFEICCVVSDFENYSLRFKNDSQVTEENVLNDALCYICECVTKSDYELVLQKQLVDYGFLSCEIDVKNPKKIISDLLNDKFSSDDTTYQIKEFILFLIAVSALQEFVRCNFCGPRHEAKNRYSLVSELLPESKVSDSDVAAHLSLDSELVYYKVLHPKLLYISHIVLENIKCTASLTRKWWLLRCTFLHQTILPKRNTSQYDTLKSLISDIYQMDWIASKNHITKRLIFAAESSHIFLYYGKIDDANKYVTDGLAITGLEIDLSSALGKRTRYQQKPTSQLFVKLKRKKDFNGTIPEKNELFPSDLYLQDDTLLNTISFMSDEHNLENLFVEEQLILLSHVCLVERSESFDDVLKEKLMSYIDCLLSQSPVWSVYLKALTMRCKYEKKSIRLAERAKNQMEAIVESVKKQFPPFSIRQKYFYSAPFSAYWVLEKDLADLLKDLCYAESALAIYERLELWADVIECYIHLGRTNCAEKVIREQLKIGETPTLWCILGDVTKNTEFYIKAWELSNHKSARAQCSLGYFHYRKKEYEKCIPFFRTSLEINRLQSEVWFSLGHAYTQIENYKLAVGAYRQVVMLDEDNPEVWNNLANAFIKMNEKKHAWRSLTNALKYNNEEWRMWENYLLVSTDIGAFEDAIHAWHRLFEIKGKHSDNLLLEILVNAITQGLCDKNGLPSSRLRSKALKLLGKITSVITNDPKIWELYSLLQIDPNSETAIEKEELEKAFTYQQKALLCYNHKDEWEKDFNTCKVVLSCSLKLAQLSYIKLLKGDLQKQQKTSVKLNLQNAVTRCRKFVEDFSDAEKNELNKILEPLTNTLNKILTL